MDVSSTKIPSSGVARLAAAAIVVTGFCAAVAAAPAVGPLSAADAAPPVTVQRAAFGDGATALRPFGRGHGIRVSRAYGEDDEDCVLAVTKVEDAQGRVSVTRGVSCAQ